MQLHDRQLHVFRFVLHVPVVVAIVLLLLPLVPLLLATYFSYTIVLHLVIWAYWCTRGVNVLLVYSDSPNWHEYIEANIVPRLPASAVVINRSDRLNWKRLSLPTMAARFFGGSCESNPLVVVFRPLHWTKTYRFWKPFKDYKHGTTAPLHALETELFNDLSRAGIRTTN